MNVDVFNTHMPGRANGTRLGLVLAVMVSTAAPNTPATADEARNVAASRAVIEQWVEARRTLGRVQADWRQEKEAMDGAADLFRVELRSLEEQRTGVVTHSDQAAREQAQLQASKASLDEALELSRLRVGELEAAIRALTPRWPAPLVERVDGLLRKIPEDAGTTKRSAMERMQNVVALLNEADKFNAGITVGSEVRRSREGAEIQVQTLYLGLAQAYFVDRTGAHAGVGVPGKDGWRWTERPELGEAVRRAISMHENTTPAAFVALPLELQ